MMAGWLAISIAVNVLLVIGLWTMYRGGIEVQERELAEARERIAELEQQCYNANSRLLDAGIVP